ncbi:hypothetical protein SAMN04489737_1075 [Arcanobacterium phocae]|uniref:Uncharacterized protein n=1 Tax=Arcanobacterium phocae TaxID=131112 RepID=A0A1H2LGR9_9ACTO|nr:hypothetical protein SAMN04489737_1075 [Arcanobacterium phocae]
MLVFFAYNLTFTDIFSFPIIAETLILIWLGAYIIKKQIGHQPIAIIYAVVYITSSLGILIIRNDSTSRAGLIALCFLYLLVRDYSVTKSK